MSIGRSLLTYVLLTCGFCKLALAEIPTEATAAWQKKRIGIFDLNPIRLSSKSFSAHIKAVNVWNLPDSDVSAAIKSGERKSETFVAKLDKAVLISTSGSDGFEDRQLFVEGKLYELRRQIGSDDWLLVNSSSYSEDPPDPNAPFSNPLFEGARLPNEQIMGLWSLGDATFNELSEKWNFRNAIVENNTLKVNAVQGEYNIVLKFAVDQEYRLVEQTNRIQRSGMNEKVVTKVSGVSKDFLAFSVDSSVYENGDWENSTATEQYDVKLDVAPPPAELFDLEHYNIRFQQALPTTYGAKTYLGVLVGVLLIGVAAFMKIQARKSA